MNERNANAALAARAESHREVIRILGCTGPCKQGDIPFPTPQACLRPSVYDDDSKGLLWYFIAALGVVFVALIVAHFLARSFA